ncbi:MAG TPA: FtsX-like permease family protein, partial [Ktedonobacterales bacterium]|nr:FtsX-like permease family protein [Ktedonobacterales bacterium]
ATNRRVVGGILRAEDTAAGQLGAEYLSGFTQPTATHYYSTDPVPLARIGASTFTVGGGERSAIFEAFDYTQAGAHMHLLAGRLPEPVPAGGPIEALVTSSMARAEGLQLGDRLAAAFLGSQDHPVNAKVVGIWEPTDPNENYWNGLSFEPIITDTAAIYTVLLDQQDYVTSMATLDLLQNAQHWVYYTDARRISVGGMGGVADAVNRARTQVPSRIGAASAASATVLSLLPAAITGLQRQLALLSQPLYIVVAQVVGLTLFFVVALAELLVEDQAGEIASLKSRGASGGQLLGNYAGQSLLLGALAALVGWQLAAPAARLLVHGIVPAATLRQAGVTDAYLARLADPRASLAPALASAMLGVVAVVVAVQRAARADVLAFRREQGRAARRPLWRRLYLDVALAVVCLLGYFDLATFGGLDVRQQLDASGGGGSPLLLVAPGLLLVAGALLLLRVFPVAVAAVGRFAARRRGATAMLALAQITRAPRGPSRLTALLALALGMGLFALTVDGSLIQNAASRASFQAGADMRLLQSGEESGQVDQRLRTTLAALPAVRGVTPVYRANINVNGSADVGTLTANLLGVDPTTWEADAGAIAWRADYADAPLKDLMRAMRQHAWRADALAGGQIGDPRHPVWALVNQTLADALHLRVGQRFPIYFSGDQTNPANAVVGAIIQQFPTLYPAQSQAGYLVVSLSDATGAYLTSTQSDPSTIGPTEYWLHTDDNPAHLRALRTALTNNAIALDFVRLLDRRQL